MSERTGQTGVVAAGYRLPAADCLRERRETMKKLLMIVAMAAVIGMTGTANAADILFDLGPVGGVVNAGWASATANDGDASGGGTSGPVTLSILPKAAELLWSRDRGTAATPQGVDNNDVFVPQGTYGDMYRDFVGAGAAGIDLNFTGLALNADYDVTVWGYDSASNFLRTTSWGVTGGPTVNIAFDGDNGGFPGPDPNTNLLTSYAANFSGTADGAGALTVEGRYATGSFVGVMASGIRLTSEEAPPDPVPEPAGLGLIGLALLAVRKKRS